MSHKTIYLTGAPAAGKSTTTRLLAEKIPNLLIWEYGQRLTDFVRDRELIEDQNEVRRRSSGVITPDDVSEMDRQLLRFVEDNRAYAPIIIDSHPVTKEVFGFRITAFSNEKVQALSPDEIWVLYTPPEVAVHRIGIDPAGRPQIDEEQARMHTALQASVAANYGVITGKPVYLFDSSGDQAQLVDRLKARLS